MFVSELLNKYDFHDSNVIQLFHEENNLIMKLDLCMWKQKDYEEGEDELKEVSIEFKDVKRFVWDSEKDEEDIDYDTILEFSCKGKHIKIVLEDEDISIITFQCVSVEFINCILSESNNLDM